MKTFHIWPEDVRLDDGLLTNGAVLEAPGKQRQTLWYRVPEAHASAITPTCDFLVIGSINLLMRAGCDVRVHGQVSPSLLRNLVEFQAAWAAWRNELHCVQISADLEKEPEFSTSRQAGLVAFSGGVDSCFSAFRHSARCEGRFQRQLAGGVMVHGFDIPLDDAEEFSSAVRRSGRILSSLGLELIPMATNYRMLVEDWPHSFGAAVASCLMLLAGGFKEGLIGQGVAYPFFHHFDEGSNPLTDSLLSSGSFAVVPDGAGFRRTDKIRAMREWEEFLNNVRVCWAGPEKNRNCCECEKCIRNILSFRALGLGLPPAFEKDVSDRQIDNLKRLQEIIMRTQYDELVRLAREAGLTDSWVAVLEGRLRHNRRFKRSKIRQQIARLPYYAGRVWARIAGEDDPVAQQTVHRETP